MIELVILRRDDECEDDFTALQPSTSIMIEEVVDVVVVGALVKIMTLLSMYTVTDTKKSSPKEYFNFDECC